MYHAFITACPIWNAGEEGVDQGGVTKEFFQLLVRQIFNEVPCSAWLMLTANLQAMHDLTAVA